MSTAAATDTGLAAYLDRIGVASVTGPDLPSLRRIVAGHARSIAFENLDAFTGREVALDPDALSAKLVRGGRGGWCFEQNLLLRGALDAVGYRTTSLAARVLWSRPAEAPPSPRSHMLLRVDLPEGPHLVDVGFGGLTLTGVLALKPEVEQATPHETFRLLPAERSGYVVQARVGGEWRPLYWFDLTEQLVADYEVSNWYLCHHPRSHFLSGIMVARPDPDRRYALSSTSLAVHHLDGPTERRSLESPAEIREELEETFLIDTSGLPDLEAALARLFRDR
ncbi:arylamine N-acetyltransferase family protein [Pseudonocardia cypriaca]|uniref:N-hydroxyarylamine O-acetyltransferase n=1 Tax=Pseudonocardia cypriaca TaxID=882449 RepID=A0A543FTV1_9PSEU|nr:arylamine N-acetyltransferase [Pseudonocardia cypriaca]TQM37269.1 N-hydroxyarylamine O-acetyltransferase [Pseudonocardia cypriaca]